MRVAMGATVWARGMQSQKLDGIGHYTQEIFQRIRSRADLCTAVSWGIKDNSLLKDYQHIQLGPYSRSALMTGLTSLPFPGGSNLSNKADVFHASDHHTPKFNGIPVVATLMDAIPLSHPQWVSARFRMLKNWLWRKSGHWADHIITISEFSKQEISYHFGIPENRISVTPLGVDERYFERISEDETRRAIKKYSLPENFFLFVGTLQPRKNLRRLLAAHEMLPKKTQEEFPLILVGNYGWGCEDLVAHLESHQVSGTVKWLQKVNDLDKRILMQQATALVFPSLLEGFGLPVLEGFASQTPVICSNTSSLPEVAADAALMVDPLDEKAWAEAMEALAESQTMSKIWIAKGLDRAKRMSWDACADQTYKVYERVLGGA